jgi:arylamine N-acetyltransferase
VTAPPLEPALVDRYLRALGIPRRPPSPEALTEIAAAQLTRVPFENVSKLVRLCRLGLADLPSLDLHLEGIERFHLGGTCYANNYYLYRLLDALGYRARLCGADMRNPDVHLVVMVALDGREYLLDGGYGAPFLRPLPLDAAEDQPIALGSDRWVLEPRDGRGCSRVRLVRGGVAKHGYLAKPAPRAIEEFGEVIRDSFRPEATFRNALLLIRMFPGGSTTIHNLTRTEVRGDEVRVTTLPDPAELPAEVERAFAIPRQLTAEALAGIPVLQDAWG